MKNLIMTKVKYPENRYKELEGRLAVADQKVAYWEQHIPKAFSRENKIHELEN